jgi:hypothetical protein
MKSSEAREGMAKCNLYFTKGETGVAEQGELHQPNLICTERTFGHA